MNGTLASRTFDLAENRAPIETIGTRISSHLRV